MAGTNVYDIIYWVFLPTRSAYAALSGVGQNDKMYLLHNSGWCTESAVKLLSIATEAFIVGLIMR